MMGKRASFNKITSMAVLTMFSLGMFTVSPEAEVYSDDLIKNNSFDRYLDGWNVKGDINTASGKDSWGYDDSYSLGYWSEEDYEVWTEQTIEGLENGYYRVEAYTASGGGQEEHYIYANDFGGTGAKTSIPVSNDFTKVVLNFKVTNNQVTLGFYAKGNGGNWSNYDHVTIAKDDNEYSFLKGGDLTMVNWLEDEGAVFYDEEGEARDVFHILAENGFNFVRLRTHNDVGREHGSITNPDYYLPDGYQNTEDLLDLALRSKEMGMQIEVTLNYSDWWPNAGTQEIPSSWRSEIEGLTEEESVAKLEELIYDYTKDIMKKLADQGTTPEFISLGNEMQNGILYPYGSAANFENLAKFLNAGYRAVKEVSTNTAVAVHLDMAGNTSKYVKFLDNCEKYGVNYDVIGSSYYPFWTNKTVEEIIPWFNDLGEKYQKPILILETGYNWNPTKPDGYPGQLTDNGPEDHESSPQGQKEFLDELFNGIRTSEKNWIIGDLYWDPVMIDQEGIGWAMERGDAEDGSEDKAGSNVVSNTTLFDFDGHALPSLKSFRDNTEGYTTGILSGTVVGTGGNKITNANVVIEINGEKYIRKTDKYGNFFMVNLSPCQEVKISVSKNGYGDAQAITEIKAGQVSKVKVEVGSGKIIGKVIDNKGNSLEGVKVYSIVDGAEFSTFTSADGSYTLSDMPEGKGYTIYATKEGYAEAICEDISIVNGVVTKDVDFTLAINSASLNGRVIDEDGKTVMNASIALEGDNGFNYTASSKEDGSFELSYVNEGSYTVTINKAGYEPFVMENLIVKAEDVISLEDIILKKAFGSITGVAVDSNNNRLSNVEISISLKNEEKFNTVTDENGCFVVEEVIDGTGYTVSAKKDGYGDSKITDLQVLPSKASEVIMRLSTKISINNDDFDLGTLEGWTVIDEENSVTAQDRSNFNNDAPSGKYALSLWNDKAYTAKISQEVSGLKAGKYMLSAYVYNGGNQNKANMYIKDGEKIVEYALPTTNYWTKLSMEAWVENDNIEIGFDFDAISGCWTVIDSIELSFITAINYESLENTIKECEDLKEESYTPNSWSAFNESLNEAKDSLLEVNVTQEKINEAESNLKVAKENLLLKADKTVLLAKIEEAESIDLAKYTEESCSFLKEALSKAVNLAADENAMQEAVDEAVLKLDEAIKALVEKVVEPDVDDDNDNDSDDEINGDGSIGDSDKGEEDDKDQKPVTEDTKKDPAINNNIIKEESTEKDKGASKLPTTGKESAAIFISFAALIMGAAFLKKIKKA